MKVHLATSRLAKVKHAAKGRYQNRLRVFSGSEAMFANVVRVHRDAHVQDRAG